MLLAIIATVYLLPSTDYLQTVYLLLSNYCYRVCRVWSLLNAATRTGSTPPSSSTSWQSSARRHPTAPPCLRRSTYRSAHTTYCLLLTTYYLPLATTHYLLLTTHYLLLTTYYVLLTTYHVLLTTCQLLLTTYQVLLTTYYLRLLLRCNDALLCKGSLLLLTLLTIAREVRARLAQRTQILCDHAVADVLRGVGRAHRDAIRPTGADPIRCQAGAKVKLGSIPSCHHVYHLISSCHHVYHHVIMSSCILSCPHVIIPSCISSISCRIVS